MAAPYRTYEGYQSQGSTLTSNRNKNRMDTETLLGQAELPPRTVLRRLANATPRSVNASAEDMDSSARGVLAMIATANALKEDRNASEPGPVVFR